MRNTFFILIILFYCVGLFSIASTIDYRVIPLPAKINYVNGKPFKLTENTKIIYPDANEKLKRNARFLAEYIKNNSGLKLQLKTGKTSNNAIVLQIKPISDNKEVYNIEVSEKNVIVALPYGVEAISIPNHIVKEDGTQAKVEEKLDFKVIEFSKDAKKIFVSHTRTFEDAKKVQDDTEKQSKAAANKKSMKKVSDTIEKTTLGDVSDLANLKSELKKAEEKKANKK